MVEVTLIFHTISLYTEKWNGELVERLKWDNMTVQQHVKWNWYFNYRAALLQVKYPRYTIKHTWGQYIPDNTKALEHRLKNLITAQKRKLTEYSNKLKRFDSEMKERIENWTQLFPIEEDPKYKAAMAQRELFVQKMIDKEADKNWYMDKLKLHYLGRKVDDARRPKKLS